MRHEPPRVDHCYLPFILGLVGQNIFSKFRRYRFCQLPFLCFKCEPKQWEIALQTEHGFLFGIVSKECW